MSEYVQVPDKAVEWLKKHYPALCIKAGLCEHIAGRLYTKTTTRPAQQDAPTDADIIALARETQSADPGRDGYILPITFARALLARFAPAQDAERERDTQRIDWFDANCKRESSMRFGEEFKPVFVWAIACDPQPGATVRDAIDGIMGAARAQRAQGDSHE